MKLGAIYTVWNGLELLDGSIEQIKDNVDVVVVAWQKKSNKGEENPDIEKQLNEIQLKHGVVLVKYDVCEGVSTKENERKKHNFGLHFLKLFDCTHYILMACDHYYDADEFVMGKQYVEKRNLDVSITWMFTYYKYPTWRLTPIEGYGMPFISKLYPDTFYKQKKYPITVDPSVTVNTSSKIEVLPQEMIMLHHFSMIRVDIENKIRNAAASMRWTDEMSNRYIDEYLNYDIRANKGIEYFRGRKIQIVNNEFDIEL